MFYSLVILTKTGSYEQVTRVFRTLRAARSAGRRYAGYSHAAEVAVYKGGAGALRVATFKGKAA